MRKAALTSIAILTLALGVCAQDVQTCNFPVNLERLAGKAAEVVDVSMDANMLQFAGKFLSKKDPDEAQAQKLVANLKSLCVRSYEFDQIGQYAEGEVEVLRSQLLPPTWSRIVGVRSKRDGENVDVYFRREKGSVTGLAVIASEPKELTFVLMDGLIDPEQLGQLGGQFGIPKVEMPVKSKPAAKGESK